MRNIATHDGGAPLPGDTRAQRVQHLGTEVAIGLLREADVKSPGQAETASSTVAWIMKVAIPAACSGL
jgi:hypothetical protein